MVSSVESTMKMDEFYDSSYQVFLNNWIADRQASINLMLQNLKPQDAQVSVLSVGAGTGDFDALLIAALQEYLPRDYQLKYIAIEPNPFHCQRYQEQINAVNFPQVELEIHPDTIENFQTSAKFDVIHFTHSLYHMPGSEQRIIQDSMGMLKENGLIAITLATKDTVIYDLILKYADITGGGIPDILSIEKMQELVTAMGLVYNATRYPEYLNVESLYEENSPTGKSLMDFICQGDSSLLSQSQRQEFLQAIATGIQETEQGQLISMDGATMIISKNQSM
ncbi:methyltransferase domain-containing protein [Calothrix sp. NIES-3974]|uniref:methyltransferase domain-containing protein n=1 Tax=Calothrix sp. NIES-3974 TaxID=2005462 RepID=UPI000B60708A|nr:methyltransferase domain-containing protein [Calothrix sp. NIES-3974]BAZ05091.1 type 12 methyltransferase [Calothrix sp. NIES-3974]